ncbi:helix-turn-helix domain-containing protein [Alkalimarinus alittae]|uniref:Helix-turn-helix domain-containing protein n=1 Tax=Alkalimarinus alittae TaxID=2961619 RepID=A0ABY6N073_9ALTE|nr:helix-turn-helix domain-containing protein [Alkalimarinus alittae]UZE95495.1 helix-turn-helix domain-containing protein [Alkalimarinus alittae]
MIIQEVELRPKSIAAAMRMEGYKQKEIAKAIGVTTRTIQKWFK